MMGDVVVRPTLAESPRSGCQEARAGARGGDNGHIFPQAEARMGCRPVTGSPLLLPVVVVVVVAVVVWSLTFRSLEYYPGNDTLPRWVCTLGPSGVEYRRVIPH